MQLFLLYYDRETVGIRMRLKDKAFDIGIASLYSYFDNDEEIKSLYKRKSGVYFLESINGVLVSKDENNVIEVNSDCMVYNLIKLFDTDSSFDIGKSYKYFANENKVLPNGSLIKVLDVDFENDEVLVSNGVGGTYNVQIDNLKKFSK